MSINNSVPLLLLVLAISTASSSLALCIPREREALLKFKSDLTDPSNILSSWVEDPRGADCCLWHGVACHNSTGHVLHLRLPCLINCHEIKTALGGKLNPSLLDLKHLTHLDLSGNRFFGIGVPPFLGSLINLRYLNLSDGGFGGTIPHQLGNLSCLRYLDLSDDFLEGTIPHQLGNLSGLQYLDLSDGMLEGTIPHELGNLSSLKYLDLGQNFDELKLKSESLGWVSGLSALQHLDLRSTNLSAANDWVEATNTLPSLKRLLLSRCSLNRETPSPPALDFLSLSALDLSSNILPSIPEWIFSRLPALTSLSLSSNHFTGPIPVGLRNMTRLRVLDLSFNSLTGLIPVGLRNLTRLRVLDLSLNSLTGPIPLGLQNLTRLRVLDLSSNSFTGSIPVGLRNMTRLRVLDLSSNLFNSIIQFDLVPNHLEVLKLANLFGDKRPGFDSSHLIDHLTKLKKLTYLDLSRNSLSSPIPESIGNLSSLKDLDLSSNELYGRIPDSVGSLKCLRTFGVEFNQLNGPIPESIGNLSSLKDLNLRFNELYGPIPDSVGSLKCLTSLDVEYNQLNGPIPESIGGLSSLSYFFVGDNKLNGTLPASFGQLVNLVQISTSRNPMKGVVTELHLANLTKLGAIGASGNELSLKVSPKWHPPFQLSFLFLDFWRIGPLFPSWLQSQRYLEQLGMYNVGISSSIPNWFWISLPQCHYYNLSHNQIHGHLKNLPSVMPSYFNQPSVIDLSSNQLAGTLPRFPLNLGGLDISNNLFSGSISNFLCYKPHVVKLLIYLNLRGNHFSGEIPDCWMSWTRLQILNLEENEFVGNLPSSIGHIEDLQSFHLRKNHLEGEVPTSLMNCTRLKIINLGENNFEGNIPSWFGERLVLTNILILRSNKFHGHIPNQLCMLRHLQLLDLAHNNLSRTIPRCFNNFTAMITPPNSSLADRIMFINATISDPITEDAFVVTKDNIWVYTNNLGLMTAMDLSNNNLTGFIPTELTSLIGLRSLNLSNNFLVGEIPRDIGAMKLIESIDVAGNEISGKIPPSISLLTFLSWLNLSNNHLVGKIPMGPQLQGLPASGFSGNELCGSPLPNNCSNSSSLMEFTSQQGKVNEVEVGVFVSLAIGFIVGFWIVWLPLLFIKSWRAVYFKSIDGLWQRIADCC